MQALHRHCARQGWGQQRNNRHKQHRPEGRRRSGSRSGSHHSRPLRTGRAPFRRIQLKPSPTPLAGRGVCYHHPTLCKLLVAILVEQLQIR